MEETKRRSQEVKHRTSVESERKWMAAPTFSLLPVSSFIRYSSCGQKLFFLFLFSPFLFSSLADQTPPPLFSRFFLFLFFFQLARCFAFRVPHHRLTYPVQQPDGGHSILFLPFLPRLPYHVQPFTTCPPPPPPHAPFSTFLVVAVPSDNDDNDSPRRRAATRVHGTRIMEVFSAKVKLSGAKA